ncbi:hypothetical protein LSCM1_07126 [Leishmania martiniquensis]|uniref:Uncharacterized protein n=1 Tax=Leishmania martiniquensis TaxID=1580590 RepID=A0A836KS96_9TRYP|nr:hypothetical protein LSCM1_07126 [Leishmania martiniquensis]
MQRSCLQRRHPYAIDIHSLRRANSHARSPRKLCTAQIALQSARQAWRKAQDLFAFFFPQGYCGGPAK